MFRQAVTVERTMITQDMTHVCLNQKKVGRMTLSFIVAAQAASAHSGTLVDGQFVKRVRCLTPTASPAPLAFVRPSARPGDQIT